MELEIIKLNALIEKDALKKKTNNAFNTPPVQKNKVVRKLNSNSNSKSNSNSNSNFLSPRKNINNIKTLRKKPVTKRKSNSNSNSNSYSSRKTIRKTNYNRNNTNSNSKSKTNNQQLNELYANFEKFTLKNKHK